MKKGRGKGWFDRIKRGKMFNDLIKRKDPPEVKADLVTTIECDDPNAPPTISEEERFRLIAGEHAISEEEQRMRRLFNE